MNNKARSQKIERAIKLTWSSLDSHLSYTYKKHHDSPTFHKRCVKEYAEVIKILSDLL